MKNNQSSLDAEMIELGRERYRHKLKRSKETKLESTTSVGRHLLSESVTQLEAAIVDWIKRAANYPGKRHKAYEYINQLEPKVLAVLVAKAVLDGISIDRKIASLAVSIGRLIEDEIRFTQLKKQHPALWQQMHRVLDRFKSQKTKSKFINNTVRFHSIVLPSWDRKVAGSVGLTCIELMRQATGIVELVTARDSHGKSYSILKPTNGLLEWMEKAHDYNEDLSPVWLPMVERPMEWTNPFIGGYTYSDTQRRRPLVKTYDKQYLDELADCDLSSVYSAVNVIQNTGYQVDDQLIAVLRECWANNLPIGGLPPTDDDPLPPKPADIKENSESRRAWRKSAARVHFENERLKSKRLQVLRTLALAEKFSGQPLWFPVSLDFRGRLYPTPYFLQPQGPEWSKAILSFSEGKEIKDGVSWLYAHTGARWGLDKESYEGRVKWVEKNIPLITRIGNDPMSDLTWTEAAEPWPFVRACMEVSRLHKVGSKFKTTLPISMDATNQGLQIYSMVLRDPVAAKATNVSPSEFPQDIYEQVAELVKKKVYEDPGKYGSKWLAFGIDRKTTKRQTMTLCYGSTFFSCRTYTAEWFYDCLKQGKVNPFGEETYKPCNYLAEKIWQAISEVVQSAQAGMDYLRACAGEFVKAGVVPRWVTPLGFPVKMHYENTKPYTVKTMVGGVLRQHRLRLPNGQTNKRKTVNAICPNWVHSLDGVGGLLGETVNLAAADGIDSIMTIHDSISVHAPNVEKMHEHVRKATLNLFSEDLLANIAQQFEEQLPDGLPFSRPHRGTLDLRVVLDSRYYFN